MTNEKRHDGKKKAYISSYKNVSSSFQNCDRSESHLQTYTEAVTLTKGPGPFVNPPDSFFKKQHFQAKLKLQRQETAYSAR
jgi:hypothetical protein